MINKCKTELLKLFIEIVAISILFFLSLEGLIFFHYAYVRICNLLHIDAGSFQNVFLIIFATALLIIGTSSRFSVLIHDTIKRIGVKILGRTTSTTGDCTASITIVNLASVFKHGVLQITIDDQIWPNIFYIGKRHVKIFIVPGKHTISFKQGVYEKKFSHIDIIASHHYVAKYEAPRKKIQITGKNAEDGGCLEFYEV